MKERSIVIKKNDVYGEVEKLAAYTGAKKGETGAYDRISLVDENKEMLDRFWEECRNVTVNCLKETLTGEDERYEELVMTLYLSELFDDALLGNMERSLRDYFINAITAKWFSLTSKDDSETMAARATAAIETVRQLLYHRRRPTRI